jgi:hypothetical protein
MTPITKARTGFFNWPVMGEQVEELRRQYNILPAAAFLPSR